MVAGGTRLVAQATSSSPTVPAPSAAIATGTVTTDSIRSPALGVVKRFVVWTPPGYAGDTARRYPVLYALHGMWGRETDWTRHGALATVLDSLVAAGMPAPIVVMPDGDDGWWTTWHGLVDLPGCRREPRDENADSFCVPWAKYDDYVARDLVAKVDSGWRTVARREGRGLLGLSMGGYGATTLALRYPDVFAAAASHSGVLAPMLPADTVPWREGARARALAQWYGPRMWGAMRLAFGTDSVSWTARDPVRLLDRLRARGAVPPALWADVGRDDRYAPMTRAWRDALAARGVPLVYAEREGGHAWSYWRSAVTTSVPWLVAQLATRLASPAVPR
jgi:S-formylglutathione hydrolase FrmB